MDSSGWWRFQEPYKTYSMSLDERMGALCFLNVLNVKLGLSLLAGAALFRKTLYAAIWLHPQRIPQCLQSQAMRI